MTLKNMVVAAGIFALAACAFMARDALAETVHMKDGRRFECQVVSDAGGQVVIKTVVAGFPARLTLVKADIERIDRTPLPKDFFSTKKDTDEPVDEPEDKPGEDDGDEDSSGSSGGVDEADLLTPPDVPEPKPDSVGRNAFLEIPLRGTYGEEINVEGVKHVLMYAAERDAIRHIVFRLDSGGGQLFTTVGIQDLMKEYEGRLRFHCIVDRAISASIWTMFACDTVHVSTGGTIGGAVAYSTRSFGNAEVDAKMNSILAADLTAMAEKKGHPSLLVEPMIRMEATVAAWLDRSGEIQIGKTLPRQVRSQDVLFEDTSKTVLTLTAEQAIGAGLAGRFDGPSDNLGNLIGLPDWTRYNDFGESTMKWAGKVYKDRAEQREGEINKLIERAVALSDSITRNAVEAVNFTPQTGNYARYRSGRFTRESRLEWQRDTDRAIGAWQRVQDSIDEMRETLAGAKELGIIRFLDGIDLGWKDYQERAGREIMDLRRGRSRTGI